MKVPEGLPNPHQKVCLLEKSLYGLKQDSRQWFAKLVHELLLQGFAQILPVLLSSKVTFIPLLAIKDLGKMHYFLGIEIGYSSSGICMTQKKFTSEILQCSKLTNTKSAVTPLPLCLKLQANEGALYPDPEYYRMMVCKLNFWTHTRPDLAYTVQTLSQFLHSPRDPHVQALHHTPRYVQGTVGQGILLCGSTQPILQAYSDSDWASCLDSRRSNTGYIMMLGNSPISWKSKKQGIVSCWKY
ncbi:uncharacterized mitochondrial protein AtMg00810-like [Beta vulgaris subsp. vulgaris]|uniref:uncharacterized mitochondrial protein AtMg00810-like n=1 Tax=Beta vulgaris subsp. vulgaris TaxID=3555 RepID=UPI000901D780|nr:uncharacterized mitochondrial protein AtMg00810-like [Beta vulgaris subsp. vulgaris]